MKAVFSTIVLGLYLVLAGCACEPIELAAQSINIASAIVDWDWPDFGPLRWWNHQ